MNKTLSTTLIVIAVLALAGGIFFAGSMYARSNAFGPGMMFGYGWNNSNTYGPSMMNNYRWNNGANSNVTPLTVDQARAATEKYIQSLNIQGLETGEVMIFDNNAYVVVKESETGLGALELLVDPVSQIADPEYGPNMMWNLKYGGLGHSSMMGGNGMMSGWDYQNQTLNDVTAEMTVTSEQAVQIAQQYLDTNYAVATTATDPAQFYGYYTLDFEKDGQIVGMLSVNGYNGQIFLHTWHGTFIEEAE
jgi:Spy/CpxP family protein refolding chaperone